MINVNEKLLLENVYGLYVDSEIEGMISSGDDVYGLDRWKEFRLSVSGGESNSMGKIGMGSIEGFLDEVKMIDDLVSDWLGNYRGESKWDCREGMFELLDSEIEDVEFRNNVKNKYNEYFFN